MLLKIDHRKVTFSMVICLSMQNDENSKYQKGIIRKTRDNSKRASVSPSPSTCKYTPLFDTINKIRLFMPNGSNKENAYESSNTGRRFRYPDQ